MTDEKKTFTVRDRRHFTPDGENRDSRPADEESDATSPPLSTPSPEPADGHEIEETGFFGLIVSLAMQARTLLGEGGDLRGARSIISILEMLKEKTEGNRTTEESDVLESLLYELRLGFVERSRAGGA